MELLVRVGLSLLLLGIGPAWATTGTWTNYVNGGNVSDYWTNNASWNPPTSFPGASPSESAFLTNRVNLAYTNILDFTIGQTISTLAISNTDGEAWLIVTNSTLMNTTFNLDHGGRLQIDNGGVLTNTTTFAWRGNNGAIHLNNGGRLFTTSALAFSDFNGAAVNALVTSGSGPGNGGVWNLNGQTFGVGGGTAGNAISITGGAVVTNSGAITLNGNQNSLLVTNGGQLFGKGGITFNTASSGNTLRFDSGFWDLNATTLTVGGGAASSNNLFLGSTVSNLTTLAVGSAVGGNGNSVVVTNGAGFFMTGSGGFFVGGTSGLNAGGNNNTVVLSNSTLLGLTGQPSVIGSSASNNSVALLGDTHWNNRGVGLYVGIALTTGGATGNVLTIQSGLVTNIGWLGIGAQIQSSLAGASINNRIVTGAIFSNVTKLIVGGGDGVALTDATTNNNYNSLIVTNGGGFNMDSGQILIGATRIGTVGGGSHNTVILSNGVLGSVAPISLSYVGRNSSSNSLTLLSDLTWIGGGILNIGFGGTGNVMTVHGARVSLGGALQIGSIAGASGNQFLINNGGIVSNVTSLSVGGFSGLAIVRADNNSLIATNGSFLMSGSGGFGVGAGFSQGNIGGNNNTVILSNATLLGNGSVSLIGSSSSSNTVTLLGTTLWDNKAGSLHIGYGTSISGAGTGNVLTISSGLVTNVGSLGVAAQVQGGGTAGAAVSNQVVTGAIFSNVTKFIVGGSDGTAFTDITPNNNYNSFIVTNGGGFNMDSGQILIGASRISATGGNYNQAIVSNGLLKISFASIVGGNSSGNELTFLPNLTWNGAVAMTIGSGAATGNVWNIHGAVVSNLTTLTIGTTANSVGNRVLVDNAGALSNLTTVTLNGHLGSLTVTNGSLLIANTVQTGFGNSNSILVTDGGVLQANTLAITAGTSGNTISNRNGVYQFGNAAPTITPLGAGSIAITDGTIAFRNLSSGLNLTNNWRGSRLTNIAFAGNNTLRLDNSTAANTLAGGYTFNTGLGATNYYRLEMINGTTAVTGNGLTIGTAGALLISNTTASVTGVITNHGQTKLVSATASFAGGIINSGGLSLQNATLTGVVTNLATGTLRGDGLIVGDVMSFGTNSPGFSAGTLSITGAVTFGSSAVTWMELFGNGSNDLIIASGLLTFGGELSVTNSTGFSFAAGQSFQLFQFGSHAGEFGVTNLPDLAAFNLVWDTSQLIEQGVLTIAVVPEPSAVMLVVGGLLLGFVLRKRGRSASAIAVTDRPVV